MLIKCPDLAEALEFFTTKLNFRLDMIMPADSPQMAVVSKNGDLVRLEQNDSRERVERGQKLDGDLIVQRFDDSSWVRGRAGMEYRDLIPGGCGGRIVASHIRLTEGGEVADYVHYHKVEFQVIYCLRGAIRVVYEDQGEPFWLRPGDCVLQPPAIRHRVLEAEAGSEVVEVGCPAVHETWVDHEMRLPTEIRRYLREFGGQRFVRHVAKETKVIRFSGSWNEIVDTGIRDATGGLADVTVRWIFGEFSGEEVALAVTDDPYFFYVLDGRIKIETLEADQHDLSANDSVLILPSCPFTTFSGASCKMLVARLPRLQENDPLSEMGNCH
jgi:quercetin dioxygenase-like cupin family protein